MFDEASDSSPAVADHGGESVRTTTHVVGVACAAFPKGARRLIRFFASCVDGSGASRVTAVTDLRPEAIARLMRDHFEQLGGVPDVAAFDELPTTLFVRPSARGPLRWDASLVGAMRAIGVELDLRRRGSGKRLGQEVATTFFDGHVFVDERDLEAKLASWCDFLALERVSRSGEHVRLKPLDVGPDAFAVPVDVRIATSGVVYLDGHCYVVPEAAGQRGTALLYPSVIRLVAGGTETLLHRRAATRRALAGPTLRR
jgi:hypothetical protein